MIFEPACFLRANGTTSCVVATAQGMELCPAVGSNAVFRFPLECAHTWWVASEVVLAAMGWFLSFQPIARSAQLHLSSRQCPASLGKGGRFVLSGVPIMSSKPNDTDQTESNEPTADGAQPAKQRPVCGNARCGENVCAPKKGN
jgi:hypothetical protein